MKERERSEKIEKREKVMLKNFNMLMNYSSFLGRCACEPDGINVLYNFRAFHAMCNMRFFAREILYYYILGRYL